MTRQVQMRLIVTVEDDVTFGDLTSALLADLRRRGEEKLEGAVFVPADAQEVMNPRLVFWRTADIRRGPQTVERQKKAPAT